MGALGRLGEQVKQAFGCGVTEEKDWKPTSNERNNLMLREAKKFSKFVHMLHDDITAWSKNIESGLVTMKAVLETPMPKAFHKTIIQVEAVDPTDRVAGQHVRTDVLVQASAIMKEKVQSDVLAHLEQWLAGYEATKERNKKCEVLCLDVDRAHREMMSLQGSHKKLDMKTSKVLEKGPNPKAGSKLEESLFRMNIAIDKEKRLNERFLSMEGEVYNALLILIQDTEGVRDHVAASLLIMRDVFSTSYAAFDLSKPVASARMPQFYSEGGGQNLPGAPSNPLAAPVLMDNTNKLRASMVQGTTAGYQAPPLPVSSSEPNPFIKPIREEADNPFGPPAVKGGKATSNASLPPAPAWYTEAKGNARAPTEYDSDDDNPFAKPKSVSKPSASKPKQGSAYKL